MSDTDAPLLALTAFLGTAPEPPATSWKVDLSRSSAFRPKGVVFAPRPVPAPAPPVVEAAAAPAPVRRTTGRLDQLLKHSERQLNKRTGQAPAAASEE